LNTSERMHEDAVGNSHDGRNDRVGPARDPENDGRIPEGCIDKEVERRL